MSKVSDLELSKDNLFNVICEAYELSSDKKITFSLLRRIKCTNIDVKLVFKLTISVEYNQDSKPIFSIKCGFSTNSISLRKTNQYWSDDMNFSSFRKHSTDYASIEACIDSLTDDIIKTVDMLRICMLCHMLYKDPRDSYTNDMKCIYCLFDRAFHNTDCLCVICNEAISKDEYTYALSCTHTYHTSCILKHFINNPKRECPLCREHDTGYT